LTESPIISPPAERFAWAAIIPVAMVAFQESSTFARKFGTVTVPTAHPWTLTELITAALGVRNGNKRTFVHGNCRRQPRPAAVANSGHTTGLYRPDVLVVDKSPRMAFATTLHLARDGDGKVEGSAMRRARGHPQPSTMRFDDRSADR
jgi:hypothetical protein